MTWQGRTLARRLALGAATAALLAAAPAGASPAPAGFAALQPNTPQSGSHLLIDGKGMDAGLRPNDIPTSLGIAFQKGFVLNPAAATATCTVDQANNEQCPDASRLGAGAIGVTLSGSHYTAQLTFFRADPPQAGDQGGIILYFKEPQSGFSGAGVGSIRTMDDPTYGELIRFDKLPLPNLPPGLDITLDHIQLDLGAGSSVAPAASHDKKKTKKKHSTHHSHHKVRLRCARYRGHGRHRHCVRYLHGKRNHLPPRARKSQASVASFIANPQDCSAGSWAIQFQVGYKTGQELREAQAPCVAG